MSTIWRYGEITVLFLFASNGITLATTTDAISINLDAQTKQAERLIMLHKRSILFISSLAIALASSAYAYSSSNQLGGYEITFTAPSKTVTLIERMNHQNLFEQVVTKGQSMTYGTPSDAIRYAIMDNQLHLGRNVISFTCASNNKNCLLGGTNKAFYTFELKKLNGVYIATPDTNTVVLN